MGEISRKIRTRLRGRDFNVDVDIVEANHRIKNVFVEYTLLS